MIMRTLVEASPESFFLLASLLKIGSVPSRFTSNVEEDVPVTDHEIIMIVLTVIGLLIAISRKK